jgi:uncharacterized membrane protein
MRGMWPDANLEFLGQSGWWIAIGMVVGVALWVQAWLTRGGQEIENRKLKMEKGGTGWKVGDVTGAEERRMPAARGLAWASTVVGTLAVLGTGLLAWIFGWLNGTGRHATTAAVPVFLTAVLAAAMVLLYRGTGREAGLTRRRQVCLVGLRVLGMLALVLLLFRPVLAIVHGPAGGKPVVAIVVDASASMGYNDMPNQPNRFRQAALAIENTLTPRLEKAYKVDVYAYDGMHTAALPQAEALDSIVPNGEVTDLGAAIGLAGGKATQTVLFSDGIHNGALSLEAELGAAGGGPVAKMGPVNTVRVGSSESEPSAVPDIAVAAVEGPQTAIVNNAVTLTATIKSTAMSDRTVRVSLWPTDGPGAAAEAKPLDEQRLVLRSGVGGTGGAGQTVQLHFTPSKVGRVVVRVSVPVDPGERSDANNQQDFALLVTDPKLAVLYVEGRVRPEVGPLRRTLEGDANLVLVSMVQTVAGRFEMTGLKAGDDLKGLPTNLAQWKRFKVVILGDLDASFLNAQQQKDLDQMVRDGGGLLMIGGQNSFAPGGWGATALGAALPVTLNKLTPAQINTPFVPQLTAMGAAHPIFRNIAPYFLNAEGKKPAGGETVPELSGCVALGTPKPGATVLAVHPTEKIDGKPATVLAVEPYGKGRTAAFAADTTFRWNLTLRALGKVSPYNRFWGQMVRWLAAEETLEKKTGASVTGMLAKERFEAGEPVPLKAAITDKDGQATSYAQAWADVTGPDGQTSRVELAAKGATGGDIGMYEATAAAAFKPALAGTYKVVYGATKDKTDLGRDETTFRVLPAAGEREILAADPHTLELIAARTRGTAVDLSGVEALADRLLAGAPPAAAGGGAVTVPLYDTRWCFAAFVGLVGLEWLLRRRWQLQ